MADYTNHNEVELVNRVARGDEQAFRIVFQQYWPRVYSVALIFAKSPEVAEDAAQEVFAHLWMKKELLKEVREFKAYLLTAARNHILNKLRREVFTGTFDEYLKEYFADSLSDPAASLELKEASHIIEAGISQLTPQQQKVFKLSRFQGLTHAEIAVATGLSQRTVKNYMVSAILSLRNYLDKYSFSVAIFLWMVLYL
ncbi:RNA polymerase sigma factor [Pseudoflavitalea rhizosphaerae]|uniref:RNA polymerase sigma factor n=1 Tax=Pseudoflavitalea rhizosphaerae TaxID=1884793 RepID=UPI0013E081B1|nr:RNA polymerase sigma-70 factor [Pseudoflavitalea rhizosphaerae]